MKESPMSGMKPKEFSRKRMTPSLEKRRGSLPEETAYREAKRAYGEVRSGDESTEEEVGVALAHVRDRAESMQVSRDEYFEDVSNLKANIKLAAVETYIALIKELNLKRKAYHNCTDLDKKLTFLRECEETKRKINGFLDVPPQVPQVEKALYEYIKEKQKYHHFRALESELAEITEELTHEKLVDNPGAFSASELARISHISEEARAGADDVEVDIAAEIEMLRGLEENDATFEKLKEKLLKRQTTPQHKVRTKAQLRVRKEEIEKELGALWQKPRIRAFEQENQLDTLLKQVHQGAAVIETPSVIERMNTLTEWEQLHTNSTIGGVLVGEPGTGKTTALHHYLEMRGRKFVYLDLSEEVTRYMLYGTRALESKDYVGNVESLLERISMMSSDEFAQFVSEQSEKIKSTYSLKGEEAEIVAIAQLEDALKARDGSDKEKKLAHAKTKMQEFIKRARYSEIAKQFHTTVHKNGWRDGVIIAALRRGDSVILDEFNKSRDLTAFYGLMTQKPGTDWYFEDNDERIHVPEHWRMYFTGNIGRKHGVHQVPEAVASRAQGKIMEVSVPPLKEEIIVSLALLTDASGTFLRNEEDLTRMMILVKDVLPVIRNLLKGKEGVLPVSWRTLRFITEKLLITKKEGGVPVTTASDKTFDDALLGVILDAYSIYEDKKLVGEIAEACTNHGLLLSSEMKNKLVPKYMSEEKWTSAVEAHTGGEKSTLEEQMKKIQDEGGFQNAMKPDGSATRPVRIKK